MEDSKIFKLIEDERQRQLRGIELIASENFVSDEVLKAMGSWLTFIKHFLFVITYKISRKCFY